MLLNSYLNVLGYPNIPSFLVKYLSCSSLKRLKNVGYFCGMDYASKDIYDFSEYITRFDHSLTTSLMVYNLTHDKIQTIAALFHDVGTPCFSHVIDYMNKDYLNQESTEEYTETIMRNDLSLLEFLQKDHIAIADVINFKKYSIVDNKRPKVCADRLDGIILTGIGWTRSISFEDIQDILKSVYLFINEDNELEIGFNDLKVTKKVVETADLIDEFCHTKEDNYMMELLAQITKRAIDIGIVHYEDLYKLDEKTLFELLKNSNDLMIKEMLYEFITITADRIPNIYHNEIKKRVLKPICNGKRF